jgi:hypothetical protein
LVAAIDLATAEVVTLQAMIRTSLAQRPRLHLQYTVTYPSWLYQVDRWYCFAGLQLRHQDQATDLALKLLE